MNIWILNHHAVTPDMGGGTRHFDFAKALIKRGHRVTIFTSSFHYAKYTEMKHYDEHNFISESIEGVQFIWLKTAPYRGNGFARVKNMLSYMFGVLKVEKNLPLEKPDIIMGSSVHLFAVYAAYRLARKYRTPFIFEVRDLWPQTLIDMGISKWHPFILFLGFLERFLYRRADRIITLLPKADNYISRYTDAEKIVWISNGAVIRNQEVTMRLNPDTFNLLYAGSMGQANDLERLVESASYLVEKNIHLTLIGDGAQKAALKSLAATRGIKNISFLDPVSKIVLYSYLKSADLLYVGLKDLPLYRFGISMNKLFEYMSVAKPILFVTALKDTVIERAGCGMVLSDYSPEAIAQSIEYFSRMTPAKRAAQGKSGYNYLEQNFTIEILAEKMEKVFTEELKGA